MRQRPYPTPPAHPGQPEQREHTYSRHGVRAVRASCVVPTGQGLGHGGLTRPREDCAAHRRAVVAQLPTMARDDGVLDNLNTPWRLEVCRRVASWCDGPGAAKDLACGAPRRAGLRDPTQRHVCHSTPPHGSWLNQVAWWCRVVARRFLTRGEGCAGEDLEAQLCTSLEGSHTHEAHPYRWTYTGQPLVRATPFRHTRRQQRQGRAWCRPRPPRLARALYPPRPYKRKQATNQLVMNL